MIDIREKHAQAWIEEKRSTEMLKSLNTCFCDVEENEELVIATLLDPWFKNKFFSGIVEKTNSRDLLEEKVYQYQGRQEAQEYQQPSQN